MMRKLAVLAAATICAVQPATPQTAEGGQPALLLNTKAASLRLELEGGSISDFHLTGSVVNPLAWDSSRAGASPRPMGHFLCLDRWGPPSKAEHANGMPFHGEASRVLWRAVAEPASKGDQIHAEMAAALPLAGLEITRRIRLSQDVAVFMVTEYVKNTRPLGRIYNMVQHPTIAPPFLDEQTVVDSNAARGFMQSSPLPNPENPAVDWPHATDKGARVDIRRLSTNSNPNVVSYTVEEEYGWTTASSVSQGLLIGYMWKTSEYPWFNAWRHAQNGKPAARGLEFGTTGLHQPFPILVRKSRIFDRPLYSYIDAGATDKRSYAAFLFRIPTDYKGVAKITYANGELRLDEHGGRSDRTLTMKVGDLFSE